MKNSIEPKWLGERLHYARQQRGLTLLDVSEQTKISIPTLSRIERGDSKTVQSDTLLILMDWLGTDLIKTNRPAKKEEKQSTPEVVALYLRADKNLDAKTAGMLEDLFRSMYESYAKQSKKR